MPDRARNQAIAAAALLREIRRRRAYRVRCHLCMRDFSVPFKARDDDGWAVFQRILERHRATSPACAGGRNELQIIRRPRAHS